METTKTKKMSWLLTVVAFAGAAGSWLLPDSMYQAALENEFIRSLKKKVSEFNKHLPEDRIYLQLDKPFFEPGDNIWFSALVRDAATLKPSAKSDIVTVELINPKGNVEKKINLIARNGKASGDFSLDKEALGGLYKLRAYTNWMRNQGEESFFTKDIQVQDLVLPNLKMKLNFEKKAFGAGDEVIAKLELNTNENKALANHAIKFVVNLNGVKINEQADVTDKEGINYIRFNLPKKLSSNDGLLNVLIDYNGSTESISRSIPIVLNAIKFTMYPEGGDLVSGLSNQLAFRALNEFGKPADVEGIVLTEKGSQVAAFKSFYQGMGAFPIIPQQGENYHVKITKPEGIEQTFPLPQALKRGYVMNVDNSKAGEMSVLVTSTEAEELSFVAQVRGKVYYTTIIKSMAGADKFSFPTQNFPIGVAQLTLFDGKGIARAERLAFVNKHKQLSISVETEKEKYLPREKVRMTISVKDERGLPMPANLSMAVVNDQYLTFADDKSGNILSQLLLQQDLREKVEEPAFYFDNKESKSDQALDYLMLTAGWRRFTWEKLLEEEFPPIQFQGKKAIIAGKVLDAEGGKVLCNVKIKFQNGAEYVVNEKGAFSFSKVDLSEPQSLSFECEGYYPQTLSLPDYDQNKVVYLYKLNHNYFGYVPSKKSAGAGRRQMEEDNVLAMEPAPMMAPMALEIVASKRKHVELKKQEKEVAEAMKDEKVVREEPKEVKALVEVLNADKVIVNTVGGLAMSASMAAPVNVMDLRAQQFGMDEMMDAEDIQPSVQYYRARQFEVPQYNKEETVETRTDFRNAIYWNPNLEIGYSGKKTVEFYASDDITSYRTTVEGIGNDGTVGRVEKNIYTQLPFVLSTKIPVEVATEDFISIPVTLKNNTTGPLGGLLSISAPEGFKAIETIPMVQTIMPGKAKTIYLDYKVLDKIGIGSISISFKACGLSDAMTQNIKIAPKGFPVQVSFSAQDLDKDYEFEITKMVQGSLKASFTAFPNVVSDLMKGVEGILQEPYGCFEQTSCSAYPNAMVLDYLKNTNSKDTKTLARATDLLDRGYKRLTSFEASNKGYEWFGANPGHEGLTAYGIMEFTGMKKAGQNIDQKMLDRTAAWLFGHKDGKGGFEREQHAYHDFGRISADILNAYIVYALVDAGYSDIKLEFETAYTKALKSNDPYQLAMMANAAYGLNQTTKGNEALNLLISNQAKDGSFTGTQHSITYSQGESLTIETTALGIMAILNSPVKNGVVLNSAVHYLVGSRSGSGVFSSTQGTILALKALTEFAKFSKKTNEDGSVVIYIDNVKVAEKCYKAGDQGEINVSGLEHFIKGEGKHHLKIKYPNVKTALPYAVAVNWSTSLPNSDKACSIDISTRLSAKTANVGETVRLATIITNKKDQDVPSTMAIIGIPAGFTAQAWQLKELQEKKVFDYFEIKGNNIAVYYRGLGANAVKEINLDLKAEMPGTYDTPASSAYLYYTNEFKTWSSAEKIQIKKPINS